MSDSGKEKITVTCDCGAQLRVGREAVGKRGRCPKCQSVFVVPEPEGPIPIADEDEFDLLAQAVADQGKAEAISQPERTAATLKCPACGAAMAPNAVLCIECGHNVQTGKSARGASATQGGGALKRMASGAGTFLLGCLLSGVGAMLGAAIWCGIAIAFDMQSAIIAWGLGLLAGGGMVLGYRQKNRRAGFTAAGIALVGIVTAKIFIVVFVISVLITGDTENVEIQKAVLAGVIANEELDERGVWTPKERLDQWEETYQRATKVVLEMPAATFERRWQQYKEDFEIENAYEDETGAKWARVARWQASQLADEEGLSYGSPQREAMYKEAFRTVKTYGEEELAAAVTEVDAWYERDKTGDEAYMRTQLIYAYVDDEVEQRNEEHEEYWDPSDDEWKTLFDAQTAVVDAMSAEERAAALKGRETDFDLDEKVMIVTEHEMDRQALREGLAYTDERRRAIYAELETKSRGLSKEELDARITEINAWDNGGMWADADYLRDRLIEEHTNQALREHRQNLGEEDNFAAPSPEEWTRFRDEAVTFVDAVPPDQYREHLELMQQEQMQKWEAQSAARTEEESVAIVGMLATMFAGLFGPMDLLFMGLALWSAFRLASGGGVE